LNLDGMLDLVVVNRRENVTLFRNVGWGDASSSLPMGNWLAIKLSQPAPNLGAVGAFIEVRKGGRVTEREVVVGGGHAGGQLGWIHFGLGPHAQAQVRVQWPDGERSPWMEVDANSFLLVERGQGDPRVWSPG
jgi:hypothetical protein